MTGAYHRKWKDFTRDLRKLMRENPTLPVVVSVPDGTEDREIACTLTYVHDPRTGDFREKIILIHKAVRVRPEFLDLTDDDLAELPF